MTSTKLWAAWAVAAVAVAGCGADAPSASTASEEGAGTIRLALSSMSGSATYVLANGTFLVERTQPPPAPGDITGILLHASDTTTGHLTASLDVGRYTVTLLDGWELQRQDAPTTLVPVEATLQSMNPVTVSVFSGQTTFVTFQFQTTGIPITFGPGSIDVSVGVGTCDPAPPPGVELNVIANHNFEVNTDGWTDETGAPLTLSVGHCGLHGGLSSGSSSGSAFYDLPDPGTRTTYQVSAWVRQQLGGDVTLAARTPGQPSCRFETTFSTTVATAPGAWVQLTGHVTIGAPGCTRASLILFPDSSASGLSIDDVYAVPQ